MEAVKLQGAPWLPTIYRVGKVSSLSVFTVGLVGVFLGFVGALLGVMFQFNPDKSNTVVLALMRVLT